MRTRILATAIALCAVPLAACGGSGDDENGTLTIGIVGPLSGPNAEYGEELKKGAELALKQVSADSDVEIKLAYCDDKSDSAEAVACGRKLVSDGAKVVAVAASYSALPLTGFNEQEEFIVLATSQATELTSQGNKLVIRSFPDPKTADPDFARRLYEHLSPSGITSIGVMELSNDTGKSFKDNFGRGWQEAGGTITGSAPYSDQDTDFADQLQSLLSDDPDAITLSSACPASAIIIKQARQLGFDGPFINSVACPGGAALTGLVDADVIGDFYAEALASTFVDGADVLPFNEQYKEEYGAAPTQISAAASYLSVHWTALALTEAGGSDDVQALRDAYGATQSDLGEHNVFELTELDSETGSSSGNLAIGFTSTSTGGKLEKVDQP